MVIVFKEKFDNHLNGVSFNVIGMRRVVGVSNECLQRAERA